MLKRVQHDKKKYVIPNLFRNLEFWNANELIAFVLIAKCRMWSVELKIRNPQSKFRISRDPRILELSHYVN